MINSWVEPQPPLSPEDFYITSWDRFEFLPGVFEAFKLLDKGERHRVDYDYRLIVISNQSGIGMGVVDEDYEVGYGIVDSIFQAMETKIQKETGVWLDYCFCPHSPDTGCACRKPKPGMIYKYAVDYDLDLSQCWMIGDQGSDITAGLNAGIPITQCLLITDKDTSSYEQPSLLEAIKYIIEKDNECNTSP